MKTAQMLGTQILEQETIPVNLASELHRALMMESPPLSGVGGLFVPPDRAADGTCSEADISAWRTCRWRPERGTTPLCAELVLLG
jgi:hypothetical protein